MQNKPMILLENTHYQYEHLKDFIELTGWDYYFLYNTLDYDRKAKWVYDKDLNKVSVDELKAHSYSAVIKNGSSLHNKENDPTEATTTLKAISFSHSILGMTVDHSAGIPSTQKRVGLYPKCWENIPELAKKLKKYGKNARPMRRHPIIRQVVESPRVDVEPNTLGLVLGCEAKYKDVIAIVNNMPCTFDKIYVKVHPLKSDRSKTLSDGIKGSPVVMLDKHSWKYDFTDRCEYMICGSTSMYAEAMLRSRGFKRDQGIYVYDDHVGASMTKYNIADWIPNAVHVKDFELGYKPTNDLYDDMILDLESKSGILAEMQEAIEEVITELENR